MSKNGSGVERLSMKYNMRRNPNGVIWQSLECVDLEELKLWHVNKADREWKQMGSKRKHELNSKTLNQGYKGR